MTRKKEKAISHKHVHHLVLGIILIFSLITFMVLGGRRDLQFLIGFVCALSYALWGIIYHFIEGDLYPRIIVEYVSVATVSLLLLYTVLYV